MLPIQKQTAVIDKPSGVAVPVSLDTCDQVGKNEQVNQELTSQTSGQVAVAPGGQSVLPWSWGAHRPLPGFSHEEINQHLAESLKSCGRNVEAEKVEHCHQDFKVGQCNFCLSFPAFPISCDSRLCSFCASKRSEILISEHHDVLRSIHYPKALTLTFLSVDHLSRDFILRGRASLKRLRHRKVMSSCRGGLPAFEFTYTPGVGWHMHIHLLIDSGYIDQALLSREWEELTGAKIVYIRAVKGDDKWDAIRELVKYPTKVESFMDSPDLVDEFLAATRGLKLVCGFGALYRVRSKNHGKGKMCCPVCGHNDIDFGHGCGFHVGPDRVQKIRGGYLWLRNRAPPLIGG